MSEIPIQVLPLLLGGFHLAFLVFGAYLMLYLALSPAVRLPNLACKADLFYGLYIYAWPVQQMVTHLLGDAITWYWNAAISLPVVLGLAWLSWRFVEKPALSLKRSAGERRGALSKSMSALTIPAALPLSKLWHDGRPGVSKP